MATSGMQPDLCLTNQPKGNIMSNPNFLRNAALVFGLLAAGASYAEDTATTTTPPGPGSSYATEIRSKMANMTLEQREAYRKEMEAKMSTMTPEQREAFRKEMSSQMRAQMANMTPEQRAAFREKMKAERHERHEMRHEQHEMNHEHMHSDDMHGARAR
jgi:hypothetical protein